MAMQSITAVFDTRAHADQAVAQLKVAGIPASDISVLPAVGESTTSMPSGDQQDKGFWASLEDMFGGTDDHATYAESLRRGGIVVTVHADDVHVDRVIDILEQHGSVDLDERETTWRSEGWTGGSATTGQAVGTGLGMGALGAGAVGTASATAPATFRETTALRDTTTPVTGVADTMRTGADDVVQVVEERLDIGKRSVSRGNVRLRTRVIETPVSEDVTLHSETVSIERRPVDRPVSGAALGVDAFKDRVIEVEEFAEEAVVAKSARVVEEIGIRKDATDRVETVRDTVRSTQVDIDDGRGTTAVSGLAGNYATTITDDMEVVGSDGVHVGRVDHVDGSRIKLKKMDMAAGGQHHYLPIDLVQSASGKVVLSIPAAEAKTRWTAGA